MKTTLYQLDSAGNTKVWIIEDVIHSSLGRSADYSKIVIKSGRLNGSLVENVTEIHEGKNEGKANATTHHTQALAEIESKIKLQLRKGYVYDLKDAKSSGILGSGIPSPMLAQKYCRDGKQKGSKTLKQLGLVGKTIIVQPKLDGNRCMIKIENHVATMYTRKGDVMPVQLDHITQSLSFVNIYTDEPIILDGELFSKEISFNTLNGLIKKVNVTPEEMDKRLLIRYHLYDVMMDKGYEIRKRTISSFARARYVEIVPSYEIVATDYTIQQWLEKFLEEGHEGLMIRQLGMPYEHKRTWQLCKVKVFEDEEFKLVGFKEDVRGGFVGSFVMYDSHYFVEFDAGASGQSVEERVEMWNNPKAYIGKMATVEFFGRSEYNKPRFPKFKGIRE
jgi:ATP-dependent DNA ligase